MSLALSIHWNQQYLLSVQFLLDCDPFFNPSMGRPPLNSYEPLFKKVPLQTHWPQPTTPLRLPKGNRSYCDSETDCYPGWHNCQRKSVLMGSCNPGEMSDNCPIYFLYDPKIIQSHIYNVGPVTSTITIRPSFFTYSGGIYSSNENESIIGSLDVTIIGWGQQNSTDNTPSGWWYVIPHLGRDFGASCTTIIFVINFSAFWTCSKT
ncbi:putative tubulointerstitial nephritis antigen [Histomonas meleagridis]|nr:putative tubulointerstitial nephritis antigen [Histomonas meleagridis]